MDVGLVLIPQYDEELFGGVYLTPVTQCDVLKHPHEFLVLLQPNSPNTTITISREINTRAQYAGAKALEFELSTDGVNYHLKVRIVDSETPLPEQTETESYSRSVIGHEPEDLTRWFMQLPIEGPPANTSLDSVTQLQVICNALVRKCFPLSRIQDPRVRLVRFGEEALELLQAGGLSKENVHELTDYVYGREKGKVAQEVAGVFTTLCSLAAAYQINLFNTVVTEAKRFSANIVKIRTKEARKPDFENRVPRH